MKQLHFILALSCFFLFSCETEIETQPETQPELQKIELQQSPDANTARQAAAVGNDDLETKLQWAAYAAAKVYLHDKDARQEVISTMEGNTVSLEKLIGSRSPSSPFYTAFFNELVYYYNMQTRSDEEDEEEKPPGDIAMCCTMPPTPDEGVERFIDYLLYDNCVEFYFPNLNLFEYEENVEHITSTAHPLTEAPKNYGYWRYPRAHQYPDGFRGIAHEVTVDTEFVEERSLVLVARPIRKKKARNCQYEEYNVNDFTKFLNID